MKAAPLMVFLLVLLCGMMVVSASPQSRVSEPIRCVPGTVTKMECNTCRCSSTGVFGCTKRACVGRPAGGLSNSFKPRPISNIGGFGGNFGYKPPSFGDFGPVSNFGNFFLNRRQG